MAERPWRFSIWYFLSFLLILVVIQTFFSAHRSYPLSYRDFRRLVEVKGVPCRLVTQPRLNTLLVQSRNLQYRCLSGCIREVL